MKHPFTEEDIKASHVERWKLQASTTDMVQALWESAVRRGAVHYEVIGKENYPAAIIKLPEDKPESVNHTMISTYDW